MNAQPILASLLSPLTVEQFFSEHWPERSLVAHGPLNRLPAAFRNELLRDAQTLTQRYQGRFTFGNAKTGSRTVNMDRVRPDLLLRMGLSLYLIEVLRLIPAFGPVLKQLEHELGAPPGSARLGAFVSATGNGVTCHFDSEEVFSVQLAGEKRWRIAKAADIDHPWGVQYNPGDALLDDELYAQAPAGFPQPANVEWREIDMKPGSVLFLPRGTWHQTEAGDESLSLSLIVRTPAALETVLSVLRLRMLQDGRWRRPLYGAWGNESLRGSASKQWQSLLHDLPAAAAGLSFDDALLPPLGELERLERLNRDSRVQRRPEARMVFGDSNARADVFLRDSFGADQHSLQLEVPPGAQALFHWLAQTQAAFKVDELAALFPVLPGDQILRVVDALIRARYLKQLWFDALPRP